MEILFFHVDVEKFIRSLETSMIAKATRMLELLERFGNELGMPHSKRVRPKLYELRVRGAQEARVLYTIQAGKAILLHAFVKKSERIPKRDLEQAIQRLRVVAKK